MGILKKYFWLIYAGLIIIYIIVSYLFISHSLNQKKAELINNLQTRAESLIWTIEGAARAFAPAINKKPHDYPLHPEESFASVFREMSLQPGIAWISIVNDEGRIILDSSRQVIGLPVYTKNELEALNPESYLKSRFYPDEPNIFESWKRFLNNPERVIFVGLEAGFFWQEIDSALINELLIAVLSGVALFSCMALFFYINNYFLTRRELNDVKNLSVQIIQNYPAPLFVTDRKNIIAYSNQKANSLFRKFINAKSGLNTIENLGLKNLPGLDWPGIIEQVKAGRQIYDQEKTLFMANENSIPVNIICAPIKSGNKSDKAHLGFIFIIRDLAGLKILKEEYEKDRHFSAIGKLAACMAHEIRNPLSSICGYAHYLNQKIDDPFAKSIALLMEEEGRRLNKVVTDLVTATQIQKLQKAETDIQEIVSKALLLLKEDFDVKNIHVSLDCGLPGISPTPPLIADRDKLLQVVINILLNAIQASGTDSEIRISLNHINESDTLYDKEYEGLSERMGHNGLWILNIRDHGCGMNENTLKHIFTPYFTTRENGAGLGLAMCKQIIESHGGKIRVESAPNQGSSFTIILPS